MYKLTRLSRWPCRGSPCPPRRRSVDRQARVRVVCRLKVRHAAGRYSQGSPHYKIQGKPIRAPLQPQGPPHYKIQGKPIRAPLQDTGETYQSPTTIYRENLSEPHYNIQGKPIRAPLQYTGKTHQIPTTAPGSAPLQNTGKTHQSPTTAPGSAPLQNTGKTHQSPTTALGSAPLQWKLFRCIQSSQEGTATTVQQFLRLDSPALSGCHSIMSFSVCLSINQLCSAKSVMVVCPFGLSICKAHAVVPFYCLVTYSKEPIHVLGAYGFEVRMNLYMNLSAYEYCLVRTRGQ